MILSSSFSGGYEDSAKKRLDRARLHYENLLLHAGNGLFSAADSSTAPASSPPLPRLRRESPPSSPSTTNQYLPHQTHYQQHQHQQYQQLHPPILTESVASSYATSLSPIRDLPIMEDNYQQQQGQGQGQGPPLTVDEKNEIILSLQEENDRLKQKLQYALETAEQALQDAQNSHEEMVEDYENRLARSENERHCLLDENDNLRGLLDRAHNQLAEEQQHTERGLKVLERFRRRSQAYLETQRRIQHILRDPAGLYYTSSTPNTPSLSNSSGGRLHPHPHHPRHGGEESKAQQQQQQEEVMVMTKEKKTIKM
eukprot:gene10348-11453_t